MPLPSRRSPGATRTPTRRTPRSPRAPRPWATPPGWRDLTQAPAAEDAYTLREHRGPHRGRRRHGRAHRGRLRHPEGRRERQAPGDPQRQSHPQRAAATGQRRHRGDLRREEQTPAMADPDLFRPEGLDTDQWARALRDRGFRHAVLTVKHHDGFVLYPSRHTRHSVASSGWRGGRGDVLRSFADSLRRHGIKVGVYSRPPTRTSTSTASTPTAAHAPRRPSPPSSTETTGRTPPRGPSRSTPPTTAPTCSISSTRCSPSTARSTRSGSPGRRAASRRTRWRRTTGTVREGRGWRTVTEVETVGASRVLTLDAPVTARTWRLRVTGARQRVRIAEFGLYRSEV